jgi:hypothetical protein
MGERRLAAPLQARRFGAPASPPAPAVLYSKHKTLQPDGGEHLAQDVREKARHGAELSTASGVLSRASGHG